MLNMDIGLDMDIVTVTVIGTDMDSNFDRDSTWTETQTRELTGHGRRCRYDLDKNMVMDKWKLIF